LQEKHNSPDDLKASTLNIFYNTSIFLLSGLIIFLIYSIVIKFVSDPEPVITKVAGQEPSEIIQIEVLNGSGIDGVAARVTDFLRNNGFDVVKTGNYMTSDIDETMIIDRSGNEANARKTAKILGVPENTILVQTNRDYFLDVSVIIGKDYFKLTPIK